jgi:hypothetical protein
MKRIRIAMVAAFVFAIGSAFVTKSPDKPYFVANYIQSGTACNITSSNCNLTGSFSCILVRYSGPATPPATGCQTLLTQKDTQ